MNKFDLVKFTDNDFELDVRADSENETVWLTLDEMGQLFKRDRSVIGKHVKNVLNEECKGKSVWAKFARTGNDGKTYDVDHYNLDVIISVGYRVKSERGIVFRRWANDILKDYLVKGYAINQKRIEALNKTIYIQTRMLSYALDIDKEELFKVIDGYTKALDLLDDYDHQTLVKPKGTLSDYVLTYEEAREIINSMKFNEKSDIFGIEKKEGKLNGIIAQVYQMSLDKSFTHQLKKKLHIYYISS